MKSLAYILLAAMAIIGLANCGDETCDACPTNPDTNESLCVVWNGTYYGHMTTTNGTCGSGQQDILDGDIIVEISGIEPDPSNEDQTAITVKLTDTHGNWTVFTGNICNTLDETSPKAFSFKAGYSYTAPDMSYKVENTINGRFIEQDEDNPDRIEAIYFVTYSDMNDSSKNCQLTADLTAHL